LWRCGLRDRGRCLLHRLAIDRHRADRCHHRLADVPGSERIGAVHGDSNFMFAAHHGVLAGDVKVEHDADDVRLVLRHADVRDAAARHLVVQTEGYSE
jgi:hypothetical protein